MVSCGRAGASGGCLVGWRVVRLDDVAVSMPAGGLSGEESEELDSFERDDEFGGPGPAGGESQPGLSAGAGELAGGVQEAVAEAFRFGAGQVPIEGDEAGPGE